MSYTAAFVCMSAYTHPPSHTHIPPLSHTHTHTSANCPTRHCLLVLHTTSMTTTRHTSPLPQALKPGTGTCLAAAKSYYFGVGGSTAALRQHAAAVGLAVQQAAVLDDGASNKREILALTWA